MPDIITRDTVNAITEEETAMIHEAMVEADKVSVEKLEEASEAAEASMEDAKLEPQTVTYTDTVKVSSELKIDEVDAYNEDDPLIDPEKIEESDDDIKEALKPYGVSDDDAVAVIELIREYKLTNKSTKGLYAKCPPSLKTIIDGIVINSDVGKGQLGAAKNNAAAMLLDSFMQDAKFNQAFNELEDSMNTVVKDMNEQYSALFNEAINETFEKLDEIRAENPEQAERIEAVKKAFDDADYLVAERKILNHISAKKLSKLADRFSGEAFSLNKRVSNTSMKLPKIEDLFYPIRHLLLDDEYSDDDIIKFLTVICRAHMISDFNTDIAELAYIYKLLSSIYSYAFVDLTENLDESGAKIFKNIKEVIDTIKSL